MWRENAKPLISWLQYYQEESKEIKLVYCKLDQMTITFHVCSGGETPCHFVEYQEIPI